MKNIQKSIHLWLLLIASVLAVLIYMQHRESVFPAVEASYDLKKTIRREEIAQIIQPFYELSKNFEYELSTNVDRNTLKFLQQNLSKEDFSSLLQNDNIPLWGWNIQIKNPVQVTLQISQQKKLIGLDVIHDSLQSQHILPSNLLLSSLEKKTGKNFQSYTSEVTQTPDNGQLIKLRREIQKVKLIEVIHISIQHGKLKRFESQLLIPNAYANHINTQIEKQKTIHQFFNIFHYLLIAIIFIFLFQLYDNPNLRWKENTYLFLILFIAQLLSNLFSTQIHQENFISILQATTATIGNTSWMLVLIVISDYIARQSHETKYGISDLTSKCFFLSQNFRSSLYAGWLLFVFQMIFVGVFYWVFQNHSSYVPLKIPGEHSIRCTVEFLKYFSDSLSTSIYEESLYRLFLVYFFILMLKRKWVAIVLSSMIWGFLHFSYQFEPYYIRGLELSIVGVFYGWTMLRYGILSVIVAHFLYNIFVMSEYESQFALTNILAMFTLIGLFVFSYFKRSNSFVAEKPIHSEKTKIHSFSDRRSVFRKMYPMNWKFGLSCLVILLFVLSKALIFQNDVSPMIDQQRLISVSSKLIPDYSPSQWWNLTYHQENEDILKLYKISRNHSKQQELEQLIQPYRYLWSIRFFSKKNAQDFCDFEYTEKYELIRLSCNSSQTQSKTFDEWIRLMKDSQETWTVFDVISQENGRVVYVYNIANHFSQLTKRAIVTFQNNQLTNFEKEIGINYATSTSNESKKNNFDYVSILLSMGLLLLIFFFIRFIRLSLKEIRLFDQKALIACYISCFLFILWNLNEYKEIFIQWTGKNTLQQFIFNELLFLGFKLFVLGFFSYFLFFSFFNFPSKVFHSLPTSKEWSGILSRPVWKWRNNVVSLIYATILLCIQTLLRLLIQFNNGGSSGFDAFHFDISYLNHEYLFITFVSLLWKSMMFWMLLLVVLTVLERSMPRWFYLTLLALVGIFNVITTESPIDSKLIEICTLYIVFYFIYHIARFDISFYFWFILLNTLMTFSPILIYSQYVAYLPQMILVYIVVVSAIFYTFFRSRATLMLEGKS